MNFLGMHNIEFVASTVVLSQDGTEVDLANHVSKQPQLMAPKPIYPKEWSSQNIMADDNNNASLDLAWRSNETKRPLRVIKNERGTEGDICGDDELGLLKDAMLPSFDRQVDECDIIPETCPTFDLSELDAYLAGVNCDFGRYMERQSFVEDERTLPNQKLQSRGKKKRDDEKSTSRKKPRKQPKSEGCF